MKKGDIKKIRFCNESHNAEFLGKGSFNTCYVLNNSVVCFVKIGRDSNHTDYSKDILKDSIDSPHIPLIEYLDDNYQHKIYKMPLYKKLTTGSPAYKQAKILNKKWLEFQYDTKKENYYNNQNLIFSLVGILPESLIEALHSINDNSVNYSYNYRFEFPLRNMMEDESGNLILLDVIFNPVSLNNP